MFYPTHRPRRLRQNEKIRDLVRETELSVKDFVYPLFAIWGNNIKNEVPSMPGIYQLSVENIVEEAKEVASLGISSVILFGLPKEKDEAATGAYAVDGIVQQAVEAIKEAVPELIVITDVCLCEYMSHGHCGVVKDGEILNDISIELLARTALSHAEAGADMVAPSDMMDGRVAVIRATLDENNFHNVPIMSYAAKYASGFYGPFRDAAESTPSFGDRRSYQMDPGNITEALREINMDIEEGADIIMIKPALSYLDVIKAAYDIIDYPIAAYSVSGEYSMIKAAAKNGWIDERAVAMEVLTSIKRAGADIIITYYAKDAAKWLK